MNPAIIWLNFIAETKGNDLMKYDELLTKVSHEAGESKAAIDHVLKVMGEVIRANLKSPNDEISLPGLGKFKVTSRKARTARNPMNGQTIDVPSKLVPKFTASSILKTSVAG